MAPAARITTCRSRGASDVFCSSAAWKARNWPLVTGLRSAGLKGPMKRPSSVRLAKPVCSAQGTTVTGSTPAVDIDRLTGHERGIVGGEERDRADQVCRGLVPVEGAQLALVLQ